MKHDQYKLARLVAQLSVSMLAEHQLQLPSFRNKRFSFVEGKLSYDSEGSGERFAFVSY